MPVIEGHLDAIRTACRRHGVVRLAEFGSAAAPNSFDPQRSDVDFIGSFNRGRDLGPWLAEYFQSAIRSGGRPRASRGPCDGGGVARSCVWVRIGSDAASHLCSH